MTEDEKNAAKELTGKILITLGTCDSSLALLGLTRALTIVCMARASDCDLHSKKAKDAEAFIEKRLTVLLNEFRQEYIG